MYDFYKCAGCSLGQAKVYRWKLQRWGLESESHTWVATRVAILGITTCLRVACIDLILDVKIDLKELQLNLGLEAWRLANCEMRKCLLWPPYVIGGPLYFCPVVSFMVALCNRADHIYFHPVSSFFFLLFFPRLISAVGDWMSTILRHMVWS